MNICCYGASSASLAEIYYTEAERLGRLLAKDGYTLIYGGGQAGLMGACARGASSAGGRIIGIAPRFFDEPGILSSDCTEFIYTETMSQRKQLMIEKADAFIAMPGGIGTYEEFFETLTLKQLGRHAKPMVLLNTNGYYDSFMAMLRATADGGFMSSNCFSVFDVCDSPEAALDAVLHCTQLSGSLNRLEDYTK